MQTKNTLITDISEKELAEFIKEISLKNHYIPVDHVLRYKTASYFNISLEQINSDYMRKFVWECCQQWAFKHL